MLVAGALGRNEQVVTPTGARARAEVASGRIGVEVAAGEPLDDVVLRSYAIGAAHMAYSWVTSEGLAVDPATGEIHDLTIRSFGVLRASETPPRGQVTETSARADRPTPTVSGSSLCE